MLSVAIVGGGYIGRCHMSAYQAMDPQFVRVSAVVDANAEAGAAFAAQLDCPAYTTLEEAVAQQPVDVVDICLPTFLHDTFAIRAARLGKHVLCEKPATLSLEQFDAMAAACRENRVKFMVAQVVRFMPEFALTASMLREQALGPLHFISEKRLSQPPAWTRWHTDPAKSGGGLFDLNIHDIDYLYSLFGMPERLYAAGWQSGTGCWNHVATTLHWPSGLQALCETSLEMTGDFPFSVELRATGDAGTLHFTSRAGSNIREAEAVSQLCYYPAAGPAQQFAASDGDPFRTEIEGFLQAVAQDAPVPVPPAQSREVLQITLAIRRSLETGAVVHLPSGYPSRKEPK